MSAPAGVEVDSEVDLSLDTDVLVVGSGAAGATVAWALACAGREVVVLEEGGPPTPAATAGEALRHLYRDGGAQLSLGREPMPLLQGRCVGGTTFINGAIQVPLPRAAWQAWPEDFRALAPWEALEEARTLLDTRLGVAPTPPTLWGTAGEALHRGLPGSTPIRRNAPGCRGSGRCLLGCPHDGADGGPIGKLSVDRALLPEAMARGARVLARCRVERITLEGGRATGVRGRFASGRRLRARARLVVLAASAVQSPALLLASGLRGHDLARIGRGFMAHPGAGLAGWFPQARPRGATQPVENLSWHAEAFKLEVLDPVGAFKAARLPGFGAGLQERLAQLDHVAVWGVACRAEARGRVHHLPGLGPLVRYSPTPRDRAVLLRGLARAAEGMLLAGATEVWPGVHGAPVAITRVEQARALAALPPTTGRVAMVATHLFGGIPVGPRFQVPGVAGLVAVDSSVFPSNTGVNPMSSIMAVAAVAARAWGG